MLARWQPNDSIDELGAKRKRGERAVMQETSIVGDGQCVRAVGTIAMTSSTAAASSVTIDTPNIGGRMGRPAWEFADFRLLSSPASDKIPMESPATPNCHRMVRVPLKG